MNEDDFRDACSMMALVGLIMAYKDNHPENVLAERAYTLADAMLKERSKEPETEVGIVAVKKRKTK